MYSSKPRRSSGEQHTRIVDGSMVSQAASRYRAPTHPRVARSVLDVSDKPIASHRPTAWILNGFGITGQIRALLDVHVAAERGRQVGHQITAVDETYDIRRSHGGSKVRIANPR